MCLGGRDNEPLGLQRCQAREDRIEILLGAGGQNVELQSRVWAAASRSCDIVCAIRGLVGLTRSTTAFAAGANSRSNSRRFRPSSVFRLVTPVTLPPGRARLATSPAAIGSLPIWNTIGIVAVAAFAASAAGVLPSAAIARTCRSTRSAARAGNRSLLPSAHRYSIATLRH